MQVADIASFYQQHPTRVIGIDEAGRGPLAGPVVAAAVLLDPQKPIVGLNDSKKLSEKARDRLWEAIVSRALLYAVQVIDAPRIDEINILRASLEAMALAFAQISPHFHQTSPLVLIDGNQRAPLPASVQQVTVIGGDALFESIMAASIVAKVTRDRLMLDYDRLYPLYGFAKHKGYGTKIHLEALLQHGPCPIHRKSFAPLRQNDAKHS